MNFNKITPKKIKLILSFILFFIIIGLFIVVSSFKKKSLSKPIINNIKIDSKASLSLNTMHQTSIKNGIKQWSLDASSAKLLKDNKALLKNIKVLFFLKNSKEIVLTSPKGIIDTKTNNMTFSGNVIIAYNDYILETKNLYYKKNTNRIYSNDSVKIKNQNLIIINADTLLTNLNKNRVVLKGNVKAILSKKFI
ncbi:MAG: LPS export ABC transporter periplasmic protein LptC [Desulfobacteraceae bacterium 4572_130]|nr:MAG: LPS export ABC transporter periplasmic protein LptC [Desulfobacteraceae bacterium 4572_130]